jgi:hypothetical protein
LVSAILVAVPLAAFLLYSLHATREIAWLAAMVVGLSIFAVVATGTDSRGTASDAAWREAAPDLPPASDRVVLERSQASMPGPEKGRRAGPRARDDRHPLEPGDATPPRGRPT